MSVSQRQNGLVLPVAGLLCLSIIPRYVFGRGPELYQSYRVTLRKAAPDGGDADVHLHVRSARPTAGYIGFDLSPMFLITEGLSTADGRTTGQAVYFTHSGQWPCMPYRPWIPS